MHCISAPLRNIANRKPLALSGSGKVDSFKHQKQPGKVCHDICLRYEKPSLLKPFAINAVPASVPHQYLYLSSFAVEEYKQMSGEWICV